MGRKLYKVPLDFAWPINKTWEGYINPYNAKEFGCTECIQGQTHSAWALDRLCHLICVASEDSLQRPKDFNPKAQHLPMTIPPRGRYFPHPWLLEAGVDDPGTDFHELVIAIINNQDHKRRPDGIGPLGHDGIDRMLIFNALVKAAGKKLRKNWATCQACKGHGIKPEFYKQYKAWKDYEPPKGEGFQLWETTSEGSPQTPVFKTIEELCEYAEQHCSTFGNYKASATEWRQMLDKNFVCHEDTMPDGTKAIFI